MGGDGLLSQLWGRKCIYQSQAVAETPIHREAVVLPAQARQGHVRWESHVSVQVSGLPWWLSGKEPASQCRRHGLDP